MAAAPLTRFEVVSTLVARVLAPLARCESSVLVTSLAAEKAAPAWSVRLPAFARLERLVSSDTPGRSAAPGRLDRPGRLSRPGRLPTPGRLSRPGRLPMPGRLAPRPALAACMDSSR